MIAAIYWQTYVSIVIDAIAISLVVAAIVVLLRGILVQEIEGPSFRKMIKAIALAGALLLWCSIVNQINRDILSTRNEIEKR